MGRYTLKELSALREERFESRELELERTEAGICERRQEHIAERRYLQRLAQYEHEGQTYHMQSEEDTQRALLAQADAHHRMRCELNDARGVLAAEVAALRACHVSKLQIESARERLIDESHQDFGVLRSRLVSEERGWQAAAQRVDVLHRAAAAERERRAHEAKLLEEHADHALSAEEHSDALAQQADEVTAATVRRLRELQLEAQDHERWVERERVLREGDAIRREIDVYEFNRRSMARRYKDELSSATPVASTLLSRVPPATRLYGLAQVAAADVSGGGAGATVEERLFARLP